MHLHACSYTYIIRKTCSGEKDLVDGYWEPLTRRRHLPITSRGQIGGSLLKNRENDAPSLAPATHKYGYRAKPNAVADHS